MAFLRHLGFGLRDTINSLVESKLAADMEVDAPTKAEDVPQDEPLCPEQVMNNAGGYGWKVDDMARLRRFLCLGCEGGTYYSSQKKLGLENATSIQRLIEAGKGEQVVAEIVEFSTEGRAAKQDPAVFALALCARHGNEQAKKAAYDHLTKVCRIPTHLFTFVEFAEALSQGTGWGRAHRRAVSGWYNQYSDDPQRLAMHVTKYKNRNGWTHRDLLRLTHLKPLSPEVGAVVRYVVKGLDLAKQDYLKEDASDKVKKVFTFLDAVETAKGLTEEQDIVTLISKHGLVREHIPTNLLNSVSVWVSLLKKMPMTAMMRNLGKMSTLGLFNDASAERAMVTSRLQDENALRKARIHPFNVLVALKTYQKGKGDKGKLTWPVSEDIVKALDNAFYKSFKAVEPTNLRYCLAVDVSGSMGYSDIHGCANTKPRDAAAALAMVAVRTEPLVETVAFCDNLKPLAITKDMDMKSVLRVMSGLSFGGTDCALPMVWAQKKNKLFDVFVVYTDCETWCGTPHPAEALRQYRQHSGIWNAKLIVVAMTSGGFTIADPDDPGMLDMVGFDSAGPQVMHDFALGRF